MVPARLENKSSTIKSVQVRLLCSSRNIQHSMGETIHQTAGLPNFRPFIGETCHRAADLPNQDQIKICR